MIQLGRGEFNFGLSRESLQIEFVCGNGFFLSGGRLGRGAGGRCSGFRLQTRRYFFKRIGCALNPEPETHDGTRFRKWGSLWGFMGFMAPGFRALGFGGLKLTLLEFSRGV